MRRAAPVLARTLAQCELATRAASLLAERGMRSLPLKGVVLAETVYDVESRSTDVDTDLLALDRWGDAVSALGQAGFVELAGRTTPGRSGSRARRWCSSCTAA